MMFCKVLSICGIVTVCALDEDTGGLGEASVDKVVVGMACANVDGMQGRGSPGVQQTGGFHSFSLVKRLENSNMVGTASSRRRVVWPVLSKHDSLKWSEHRTANFESLQLVIPTFANHRFMIFGRLLGNLRRSALGRFHMSSELQVF